MALAGEALGVIVTEGGALTAPTTEPLPEPVPLPALAGDEAAAVAEAEAVAPVEVAAAAEGDAPTGRREEEEEGEATVTADACTTTVTRGEGELVGVCGGVEEEVAVRVREGDLVGEMEGGGVMLIVTLGVTVSEGVGEEEGAEPLEDVREGESDLELDLVMLPVLLLVLEMEGVADTATAAPFTFAAALVEGDLEAARKRARPESRPATSSSRDAALSSQAMLSSAATHSDRQSGPSK